jgi:outer membrane protein assembly factor BamB
MQRAFAIAVVVIVCSCTKLTFAAEDNWPQWRGPLGTGVAADGKYPVKFSNKDGVAWKVKLPGNGSSTPAVWGERIFVTCQIDGQDGLVCYDMKGHEQWKLQFGPGREGKKARVGTGSNPSPVTDGKHVVAYYKSGMLACVDVGGREIWKHNLQDKFGEDTLWWDLGTSPVLVGGKVIVAVMHEGPSYLAAFDLANGNVAWKQEREYDNERESDQAYTTPQVVKQDGKDVIVTWGADHLTGHDAATGKLLWESGGFNPDNKGMWRVIASAPVDNGVAIVPYGRGEFLAAVRVSGNGDVTKSNRVWEKQGRGLGVDVPTPAVADGKAYLLSDNGQITCRDMRSGDEIWSFDLPRNRNKYYASPVLAGDLLYCTREDGTIFVGRVTDEGFEQLRENELGEWTIATPIPIRGGLLVRGEEHLIWVKPDSNAQAGG